MHELTVRTIREARTVKTLALVTLVYLPASFTTVCRPPFCEYIS
jgi:hypothetical protein